MAWRILVYCAMCVIKIRRQSFLEKLSFFKLNEHLTTTRPTLPPTARHTHTGTAGGEELTSRSMLMDEKPRVVGYISLVSGNRSRYTLLQPSRSVLSSKTEKSKPCRCLAVLTRSHQVFSQRREGAEEGKARRVATVMDGLRGARLEGKCPQGLCEEKKNSQHLRLGHVYLLSFAMTLKETKNKTSTSA